MKKRVVAWIMAMVLLGSMLPLGVAAADGDTLIPAIDEEYITVHGRTAYNATNALRLFWTNSGFTVKFEGTSLTAEIGVSSISQNSRGYLNVYVDGAFVPTTLQLDSSNKVYTLASDLPAGTHTVEVRKRNEAIYGGSASITVKNITTDGSFLTPPAESGRQIEFIGDSITSGFGNLVTDGSGDYTSATVEGTMTWAVLAAKQLGAEAQVLSRSGIGYCRGATIHGTTDNSFYNYYTKTAALPGNSVSTAAWDFASDPSDVVVINLGSNDGGGTLNGAPLTDAFMTSEAVAFLELVREKNPDAIIIWHYGLMGAGRRSVFEDAVAERNEAGDDKVFFLLQSQFVSITEGTGTHGHPSVQADINRSDDLAKFIAEKTGWEWDATPLLQAQLQWSEQYNNEETLSAWTPGSATAFGMALQQGAATVTGDATNEQKMTAAEEIWMAYANRRLRADMSGEYIVIDTCDDRTGAEIGGIGGKNGVDKENQKEGAACLTAGGTGTVHINHSKYNPNDLEVGYYDITLPADAKNWFFECWLYIDDPAKLPGQSVLEVSQTVDAVEISYGLKTLGLSAGWNKLQLPLTALPTGMTSIKNVRLFLVDVTEPVVLKLDYMVLSKGRVAAETEALDAALAAAAAVPQERRDEALEAAVAAARAAVSQADTDAAVKTLEAAIAYAMHEHQWDNGCDTDCNVCGATREAQHTWSDEKDTECDLCGETRDVAILGDVNADGKVDSTDARLVLQCAVQKIPQSAINTAVADVNADNKVDSTDARLILQYAVKKIGKLPAE